MAKIAVGLWFLFWGLSQMGLSIPLLQPILIILAFVGGLLMITGR